MRAYLILLPIFILAVLQGAFLNLNLVFLLVIIWAVFRPVKESLLIAFLSGFFLDIAGGNWLGLSSVILIGSAYLLLLYRRRFDAFHPIFLPIFVFLTSLLSRRIINHKWVWEEGFFLALLALGFRYIFNLFFLRFDKKQIKLK